MSLLQIELLKEAAQVDIVLGALYVVLGSFGLLCIWHISHTRRQLDKQNRQQIRREWRKLNLRGEQLMTLEQIDIAIAEHLGWSDIKVGEGARIWGNRPNSAGQDYRKAAVPQFHANLDWMHHAETVLIWDQRGQYRNLLFMNPECEAPVFATAAQKAEAFLRTIGKWQEPDKLSTHVAV